MGAVPPEQAMGFAGSILSTAEGLKPYCIYPQILFYGPPHRVLSENVTPSRLCFDQFVFGCD
jgi:hypothetical protein